MAMIYDANNIRRIFDEAVNQRKFEIFDELLSPTYVNHNMPTPGPGPEGMKAVIGMFINAFPDFRVDVTDVVAEGDYFSSYGRFSGTHKGDFQGIPATGKHIDATYVDIWRAEEGMLAENWVNIDTMGMMQQLGVIPS
jgi:predicted ester cyclase